MNLRVVLILQPRDGPPVKPLILFAKYMQPSMAEGTRHGSSIAQKIDVMRGGGPPPSMRLIIHFENVSLAIQSRC